MRTTELLCSTALSTLLALTLAQAASAQDNASHHATINLSDDLYVDSQDGSVTDGSGVTVAVLDSWAKSDHIDLSNVTNIAVGDGSYSRWDFHGTHVSGIIAADNNGSGAQGVAPGASILNYGVFDDNGWVRSTNISGILSDAKSRGASIANASFGVPGEVITAWELSQIANSGVLYVKAAGNDGVNANAPNYNRNISDYSNLLLVGSTDNAGNISGFSNRPGEACLTVDGCAEAEKVKYRFLVAPGESIYGLNQNGGYSLASGTSMAAPVVAGAAAVIQSRWEWLQNDAAKTADVLLTSAQDLGDAGVDGIYGHGLLDLEAALQPIGEIAIKNRRGKTRNAKQGRNKTRNERGQLRWYLRRSGLARNGLLSAQQLEDASLNVFDDYDRDFTLSMSDIVTREGLGTSLDWLRARNDRISARIANRRLRLAGNGTSYAHVGFASIGQDLSKQDARGLNLSLGFGRLDSFATGEANQANNGAATLALGLVANPVAQYADGGAYARALFQAAPGLSFAFSSQQGVTPSEEGFDDFASFARALNAEMSLDLGQQMRLTTGFTQLRETDSLLGNSSSGAFAFGEGLTTNAAKFALSWQPSPRFGIDASYSFANSSAFEGDGVLSSDSGIRSDAWALRFSGRQLFNANDSIAFAVNQPLRARNGFLTLENAVIIDRSTGEIGYVDQLIDLGAESREINLSVAYAQDFWNGLGSFEVSAGHRFNADHIAGEQETQVGASVALAF